MVLCDYKAVTLFQKLIAQLQVCAYRNTFVKREIKNIKKPLSGGFIQKLINLES